MLYIAQINLVSSHDLYLVNQKAIDHPNPFILSLFILRDT